MRAARHPTLGIAAGPVALITLLTGCATTPFGVACPAVDYGRSMTISLDEPRLDVFLELCVETCDAPDEAPSPSRDEPWEAGSSIHASGDSLAGWAASPFMGTEAVGYRLRDAAGTVTAEGTVQIDWVRVGGSEQCGGPLEADVRLPA